MDELKKTVARNMISLRNALSMTQTDLGEKLNYSDKSISKWERGESLPDAYVLKKMAEVFGVTVDYLLTEHETENVVLPDTDKSHTPKLVTRVSIAGVLTAATFLFIIFWLIFNKLFWQVFLYAIPVAMILMIVFNSIWWKKNNAYYISALVWSILLSACVTVSLITKGKTQIWQMMLLGIPSQIVVILACLPKKRGDRSERKKREN